MSLTHTTTLNAHTALILSEIERESSISFTSSADRTTAVEDQYSIRLEAYPPSYKESTKNQKHQNGILLNDEQEEPSKNIETMSKKKRRWLVFRRVAYIVIMNAAIPIALYYILKSHLPAVWALVLSSAPTIMSVIVQAIFMKRIDSIGVGVIFGNQISDCLRNSSINTFMIRIHIISRFSSIKWRSKNAFNARIICVRRANVF